jgi:hypothetical protein
MSTQATVQEINNYVQSYLQRFGLTTFGTININCSFRLVNYNDNFSNAFKVDSEIQAKQILKSFVALPFIEDIFKTSAFDESKDLYLLIDIQLPIES